MKNDEYKQEMTITLGQLRQALCGLEAEDAARIIELLSDERPNGQFPRKILSAESRTRRSSKTRRV